MKMPLRTFVWSISITVTVVVLGCFDAKGDLPAELLGKWTTAAPAYSERYFEIQEHMIVFGIDAFTTKSHYLERVETKRPLPDGRERFVFHYNPIPRARASDGSSVDASVWAPHGIVDHGRQGRAVVKNSIFGSDKRRSLFALRAHLVLTASISTLVFATTMAISIFVPLGAQLDLLEPGDPVALGMAEHFMFLHAALWPLVAWSLIASIGSAT
ncbi:MAG: hypothetical protein JRH17_22830, partial [Deltaproteobacteria bacterium]|nr:hypothetical protein [Deltaproteobacteria bacterium]